MSRQHTHILNTLKSIVSDVFPDNPCALSVVIAMLDPAIYQSRAIDDVNTLEIYLQRAAKSLPSAPAVPASYRDIATRLLDESIANINHDERITIMLDDLQHCSALACLFHTSHIPHDHARVTSPVLALFSAVNVRVDVHIIISDLMHVLDVPSYDNLMPLLTTLPLLDVRIITYYDDMLRHVINAPVITPLYDHNAHDDADHRPAYALLSRLRSYLPHEHDRDDYRDLVSPSVAALIDDFNTIDTNELVCDFYAFVTVNDINVTRANFAHSMRAYIMTLDLSQS